MSPTSTNLSQFTIEENTTQPKRTRIENRTDCPNSFFTRSKINLDIINLSRSYLSIPDFKSTLRVCKEWNGNSLKNQYFRYLSYVPDRANDILSLYDDEIDELDPYSDSESLSDQDDDRPIYQCKSFGELSDAWKDAFFFGISKITNLTFNDMVPSSMILAILEKSKKLEFFYGEFLSNAEIQALSEIQSLQIVTLSYPDSVLPLFQNNSIKVLNLECEFPSFVNEGVQQYARSLVDLNINFTKVLDDITWKSFFSVVKRIPFLKKLKLNTKYPCFSDLIHSLSFLEELDISFVFVDNIEALKRAHALKKLTFRNCSEIGHIDTHNKLYDIVINLPQLNNIHLIYEFERFSFKILNDSKLASIVEVTIKTDVKKLFIIEEIRAEDVKVKNLSISLFVYSYLFFVNENQRLMSLIKISGLKKIGLHFDYASDEPNEIAKQFTISFFKECAEKGIVTNIGDIPFIQEYLKQNPLPNVTLI